MARAALIPGSAYVIETGARQALVPGGGYLVETATAAPSAFTLTADAGTYSRTGADATLTFTAGVSPIPRKMHHYELLRA